MKRIKREMKYVQGVQCVATARELDGMGNTKVYKQNLFIVAC